LIDALFNNEWLFLLTVVVIVLAAAEGGVRLGLRLHWSKDEARRAQIGGVQSAVLGLLGLLLGFTFAMGVNRYDAHRNLVFKEANAVGTAWLRTGLLPEAHRAPVRDLLARYVDIRLKYESLAGNPDQLAEGLRLSGDIENQLWQQAEAAVKEAPTLPTMSFVTSLNEVINTDGERVNAARNRIPVGVWVLLLIVAGFGCYTTGYASGAHGARSVFTNFLLPVLIAVVILLIFDLTHSLQGVIGMSQQPLIDLQRSMQAKP
jgi:hypothetical protein